MNELQRRDPEMFDLVGRECQRQRSVLELIASENFTSLAVQEAVGTCFTNKYAEGYPGRRYYGGCEVVDEVEELARKRLCALFKADHANVQPHSGSQANMAVYFSLLQPGDVVLGMDLSHGGHLTHGSPVNISGVYYNFVFYGVDRETETIDYDEVLKIARKHRPKLIVAGASAYSRVIDFARFREIADDVECPLMVDMAHIAGLCAVGLHPNPTPDAHYVTSTTHKTLRGPRGGFVLTPADRARSIDRSVFPGLQGGPLMHVIAGKAVAFGECMREEFSAYQHQVVVNAKTLADGLKDRGARVVSGGTDNHLLLVDVSGMGVTGAEAEQILEQVGITVNKNGIPYDTRPPRITSGIRIGTPALTTRGMGATEMDMIASLIIGALQNRDNQTMLSQVSASAHELAASFPYPQEGQE